MLRRSILWHEQGEWKWSPKSLDATSYKKCHGKPPHSSATPGNSCYGNSFCDAIGARGLAVPPSAVYVAVRGEEVMLNSFRGGACGVRRWRRVEEEEKTLYMFVGCGVQRKSQRLENIRYSG
jgi:hypothetical protein